MRKREPDKNYWLYCLDQMARASSAKIVVGRCRWSISVPSFVVAATEILNERMLSTDHPCRAELFQAADRP
jgi:hypothetical protein